MIIMNYNPILENDRKKFGEILLVLIKILHIFIEEKIIYLWIKMTLFIGGV